jgi:Holliday junction resolvase
MLERSVQTKIIKKLEARGAYVVKIIQANKAGVSDILACYEGKFFAIEVKRPSGGVVSKLQKYHLEKVRKAGGIGLVARSWEDVERVLDAIF